MDNSFEEISNKIKNGIPLSEAEQQSFDRLNYTTEKFIEALKSKGLLTFQPIGEQMALMSQKISYVAPALKETFTKGAAAFKFEMDKIDWDRFRKAAIRFQELYEEKKQLWEKDRNYYKNKGFDRDFEEVLHDFAELLPEVKRMRIGEVFGMPDDDFRRLFDDWFVAYESKRDKLLEEARIRRIEQAPPVASSTEAKKPQKPSEKQKKALDELVKLLSEPNVVKEWAIEQAAKKAGYKKDNVWTLHGKVKKGELIHKELTVILTSKNESD